jgi:MoaA/NifB/PqqE/SkfB family radical SAM enzyme
MMSIDQLKQNLSTQYTLKCFVDLAELTTSPSKAYQHFDSCHQAVFDHNDRLVFYTTELISDQLLQHLYQATGLIDVSNYFVLICSPHQINQPSNIDPFQTLQISIESTNSLQDNFFVSDTLCPMPWRHVEIASTGAIRPCCVYANSVGDVKHSSLTDVFNNSAFQTLRQELLLGHRPSGCNHCWDTERNGLISNRNYHMNLLKKELLTVDLDHPKIQSIDAKPGNTCNFKCRICNPESSSLHAQEANMTRSFNWAESNSNTINEIVELLPTLSNIDMYGGEPFLIKPLLHVVQQAVQQGRAPDIRLHYNSNGSIYPDALIEYWKKFKHVDIQFSIDAIGDRFELERGGSWPQVESNIKKLMSLNLPNVKISIMPTISIMNVFYLDEVLQWAADLNLPVNPNYLDYPAGFSLKNLTAEAKKLIFEKFQHHTWAEMTNILNYIASIPDADGREFLKLCQHFDALRNQNFSKSHNAIANAMGYVYNNDI